MTDDLTPWQRYKQNLGESRPWDLLNPNKDQVDDHKQAERMAICDACPELIALTKQCKKCGCVMPFKTKLANATCPLGKW